MKLTIEIPDEIGAALHAEILAQGVTTASYVSGLLESRLADRIAAAKSDAPFETGYGIWAKYGPMPSIEELDENRREMFSISAKRC